MTIFARVRHEAGSRWLEWTTISAFAVVVACAIPFHEPWADEAQGWQLARSLSLPELFHTFIRYEASPGLWHFLLWLLIRAHVSYAGLHWICGLIAVVATSLLVFRSPFPRILRLVLPFTYFLLFQYAIVARSYVLVPLLLYLVALCWRKSPLLVALLLGLLANLALHAAAISAGLALVYLVEQMRGGGWRDRKHAHALILGALLLAGLWAFALWTAWPPQALSSHIASMRGPSRPILMSAVQAMFWGVCRPWELATAFWIGIVVCLRGRRSLVFLLAIATFAVFAGAASYDWWHVGLLIPLVICILWITWPAPEAGVSRAEWMGRIAVLSVAAVQIAWSAYALQFDHFNAYSPDLAAARFLQPLVRQGARIAVTYMGDPECRACRSTGLLPYFDSNIFINVPYPFWSWDDQDRSEANFLQLLPSHPEVVVVEMMSPNPAEPLNLLDLKVVLLHRNGYRLTGMYCGYRPQALSLIEKSCHLIFQRE
jgi:hypothetical protein